MRIISSEQVSAGHPDKICDQIADAIVTDCLQNDKDSRVAIECLFKNRCLVIAGELTSSHEPDYEKLVQDVFDRINNGGAENVDAGLDFKLDFTADDLDIAILVDHQSGDIALGVNTGGAGDQGMMYGYATNETPELLPIPFVLATRFLELLKAYPCRMLKADAKAQVSFDYDSGKITTFLCSVQHIHGVEVEDFRDITVTDVFLGRVICGKCGTVYHRSNGKNRWCYWKCYGKQKHICDNVNYTDYQLRVITSHILGTSDFDDEMFNTSIDQIIVLDDALKFIYKDGSEKIWHKL